MGIVTPEKRDAPAAVAQWIRCYAAEDEDAGSIPAAVAAFLMEARRKNARV